MHTATWNMVANIFPVDTPADLGVKSKDQNATFSEYGQVANQIKGNMVEIIYPQNSLPRPLGRGQNPTFSEHGHVAYQIKLNHECSNMVATSLPATALSPSPQPFGAVSKFNFFLNMVKLHIKLKGMTHAATWLQLFVPADPLPP